MQTHTCKNTLCAKFPKMLESNTIFIPLSGDSHVFIFCDVTCGISHDPLSILVWVMDRHKYESRIQYSLKDWRTYASFYDTLASCMVVEILLLACSVLFCLLQLLKFMKIKKIGMPTVPYEFIY